MFSVVDSWHILYVTCHDNKFIVFEIWSDIARAIGVPSAQKRKLFTVIHCYLYSIVHIYIRVDELNGYCLTDGTDVLYNKFNITSSSPQHPNSDYNCVVATTGQWRVARCDQQHAVVCQSDNDTPTGRPLL